MANQTAWYMAMSDRQSANNTTADDEGFLTCARSSLYNEPERVIYAFLGALLSLGMCGTNLVIFIIFVTDKSVGHVPGHIIITGMMIFSDILIGIIPLPGYLILTLCNGWPLPKFACDIWITMDYISTNVSYLSVTAVAFERFIAVYFVLKHRVWMCRRNQIRLVVGLWIFTSVRIICSFPVWAIASGYRSNEAYGKCDHPLYQNVAVSLVHRSVSLYIPVCLVFFFYGAIILKVFRITVNDKTVEAGEVDRKSEVMSSFCEPDFGRRSMRRSGNSSTTCRSQTKYLSLPVGSPNMVSSQSADLLTASNCSIAGSSHKLTIRRVASSNARKVSNLARMRKSLRMVSLVLFAFLLSNLPWHIIENLRVTKRISVRGTDGIYVFTWILTYMNAFPFNPLFYFFMNKQYRRAFSRYRTCTSNRTVARQRLQRQLAQSRSVTESTH